MSAHDWVTRDAVAVCARCGMVRSADRETPCRGVLPGVGLRERAAETPAEDVWADIEVARALDAADGSALPPLPTRAEVAEAEWDDMARALTAEDEEAP